MSHPKGKFIFQASIFREGFLEMFAQLIGKMVPNDHPGTLMKPCHNLVMSIWYPNEFSEFDI